MVVISSISNQLVQDVKKLVKSREYRYETRRFVAEGYRIVKDIPSGSIERLFISSSVADKYGCLSEMADDTVIVGEKAMAAMADTSSPSGVLAVVRMPELRRDGGASVVLDNLSDPGNMGTIIRSAVACGVKNIVLYGSCVDPYSPKVVRASMGGIFKVVFSTECEFDNLYALDMDGENLFDIKRREIADNFQLAVGSEAHGVSEELIKRAKRVISLPMSGEMESLNAGVSLSIALYNLIYGGN